ncbi:MAG TPA: hypothetical protein VHY08_01825 [Bacillota bacterium]|nr:hypothetical protein [Bacillota bacterium]
MSMDTLEAWCTPVNAPVISKYADHTFIFCPEKNKSLRCWGSSDRMALDAALACSGKGVGAYGKASKYRGLFDSAFLGVYGINGVCHQSANLFLYVTKNTCLPLNRERPRGIIATHALYGIYGSTTPGSLPGRRAFFADWLAKVYSKAVARRFPLSLFQAHRPPVQERSTNGESALAEKIQRIYQSNGFAKNGATGDGVKDCNDYLIQEMTVILNHYLQGAGDNLISDVHNQILTEKDQLMIQYGITDENIINKSKLPQNTDVEELMEQLNELSLQFQSELAAKLGKNDYFRLTNETQYYRPINPMIARKIFAEL